MAAHQIGAVTLTAQWQPSFMLSQQHSGAICRLNPLRSWGGGMRLWEGTGPHAGHRSVMPLVLWGMLLMLHHLALFAHFFRSKELAQSIMTFFFFFLIKNRSANNKTVYRSEIDFHGPTQMSLGYGHVVGMKELLRAPPRSPVAQK